MPPKKLSFSFKLPPDPPFYKGDAGENYCFSEGALPVPFDMRSAPSLNKDRFFEEAFCLVGSEIDQVQEVLMREIQSHITLIPRVAAYLMDSGGKRIRPLVTLLSARLCEYQGADQIPLAACVELIHAATLLHDDVVDQSQKRRGQKAAHLIWGNKTSILVGDFLFSRAFQLMIQPQSWMILTLLSKTAAILIEGEVQQLLSTDLETTSEETYRQVISNKTASLFKAGAEIGGFLGGLPDLECDSLGIYGENLGLVFQVMDDILDYQAESKVLGKRIGNDFQEGNITLPVILAYGQGTEEEKDFWRRMMRGAVGRTFPTSQDFDQALLYLKKYNALDQAFERAKTYGGLAKKALEVFPHSATKEALLGLVSFCLHRAF